MMPIHKHDAINIKLTINKNVTLISGSIEDSPASKNVWEVAQVLFLVTIVNAIIGITFSFCLT